MAYSNSSRALAFLTETSEDAIAALKGIVGGAGSAKYLDTSEDKVSLITSQIDSSRDEDRIHGLTRIVAMISKGRDASNFLPGVLKLTSSTNMDVRKLVYIILLRYGNSNPDLTLLSINSFQRDLSDPSPLIRAMALRVLSAIKVKMVSGIVLMSVAKATRDPNLYVRKIAALAVPKCYDLDRTQLSSLLESLSTLLSDRSPLVLGAAMAAFQEMCPDRWDLLHPHYRKICHALSDIDEWGQITCMEVMLRYARANFAQSVSHASSDCKAVGPSADSGSMPSKRAATSVSAAGKAASSLESFLDGDEAASATALAGSDQKTSSASSVSDLDRDLELLLVKAEPLLHSRNPAVVMAAVRLIIYLAPSQRHPVVARPVVRLISKATPDVAYVVLMNALSIARSSPELFAPYATAFLLGATHTEPGHVSLLKLDMLVTICNRINVALILPEVAEHVRSPSDAIATHAVGCLGQLAAKLPDDCRERCLAALLDLLTHKQKREGAIKSPARDQVIARAVLVIKDLVYRQQDQQQSQDAGESGKTAAIILRLTVLLFGAPSRSSSAAADTSTASATGKRKKLKVVGKGAILHPAARASILWLLGQACRETATLPSTLPGSHGSGKTLAELVLPDILRRCAANFANEASIVKLQILTVSSKAFAFLPTVLTPSGESIRLVEAVTKIHFYLLRLARYDLDFDVRDRARLCKGLTAGLTEAPTSASGTANEVDGGSELSISEAVRRATRAVGEANDEGDATLKGVRLRREQVLHILFEGKSIPAHLARAVEEDRRRSEQETKATTSDEPSKSATTAAEQLTAQLGTLSLALDGKLIRGWHTVSLPPWATAETATDASKRDPPPLPAAGAGTSGISSGSATPISNSALANARSFSSADFHPAPGSGGGSGKVVLVPTSDLSARSSPVPSLRDGKATPPSAAAGAGRGGASSRYRDLDAFLDESEDEEESESEFEVDADAPEDDEYEETESEEEEEDVVDSDADSDEEGEEEEDEEDEEEGTAAWKS